MRYVTWGARSSRRAILASISSYGRPISVEAIGDVVREGVEGREEGREEGKEGGREGTGV